MSLADHSELISELTRLERLRDMRLGGLDHGHFTAVLIDELDQRIGAIKTQLTDLKVASPHPQDKEAANEKDL